MNRRKRFRSSLDKGLKTRLWNTIFDLLSPYAADGMPFQAYDPHYLLVKSIYGDFFKLDISNLLLGSGSTNVDWIKREYGKLPWYGIYDLLEFIVSAIQFEGQKTSFIHECNRVLQCENSGYRFVGDRIAPITDKEEISEIERALDSPDVVREHFKKARDHYSDRLNPDYRNSVKESVSAVEATCQKIVGSRKTLGDALNAIEKGNTVEIATPLKQAFDKIYGFSSSSSGIRHALSDMKKIDQEDARFFLVACSALVNYLEVKADKAGISL